MVHWYTISPRLPSARWNSLLPIYLLITCPWQLIKSLKKKKKKRVWNRKRVMTQLLAIPLPLQSYISKSAFLRSYISQGLSIENDRNSQFGQNRKIIGRRLKVKQEPKKLGGECRWTSRTTGITINSLISASLCIFISFSETNLNHSGKHNGQQFPCLIPPALRGCPNFEILQETQTE